MRVGQYPILYYRTQSRRSRPPQLRHTGGQPFRPYRPGPPRSIHALIASTRMHRPWMSTGSSRLTHVTSAWIEFIGAGQPFQKDKTSEHREFTLCAGIAAQKAASAYCAKRLRASRNLAEGEAPIPGESSAPLVPHHTGRSREPLSTPSRIAFEARLCHNYSLSTSQTPV